MANEHKYIVELTEDQLMILGLFYAHGVQHAELALDTMLAITSDAQKSEPDILKIVKMLKVHVLTVQTEDKSGTY